MTFWTALMITIASGPMAGTTSIIAYPSEAACIAAMNTVTGTLPYDYLARCEPTSIPSTSRRPQRRGE